MKAETSMAVGDELRNMLNELKQLMAISLVSKEERPQPPVVQPAQPTSSSQTTSEPPQPSTNMHHPLISKPSIEPNPNRAYVKPSNDQERLHSINVKDAKTQNFRMSEKRIKERPRNMKISPLSDESTMENMSTPGVNTQKLNEYLATYSSKHKRSKAAKYDSTLDDGSYISMPHPPIDSSSPKDNQRRRTSPTVHIDDTVKSEDSVVLDKVDDSRISNIEVSRTDTADKTVDSTTGR